MSIVQSFTCLPAYIAYALCAWAAQYLHTSSSKCLFGWIREAFSLAAYCSTLCCTVMHMPGAAQHALRVCVSLSLGLAAGVPGMGGIPGGMMMDEGFGMGGAGPFVERPGPLRDAPRMDRWACSLGSDRM